MAAAKKNRNGHRATLLSHGTDVFADAMNVRIFHEQPDVDGFWISADLTRVAHIPL